MQLGMRTSWRGSWWLQYRNALTNRPTRILSNHADKKGNVSLWHVNEGSYELPPAARRTEPTLRRAAASEEQGEQQQEEGEGREEVQDGKPGVQVATKLYNGIGSHARGIAACCVSVSNGPDPCFGATWTTGRHP